MCDSIMMKHWVIGSFLSENGKMCSFPLIVNPFLIIISVFFCHFVHSQYIGALQPPTAMTLNWQHLGKFKTSSCNFLFSKMASTLSSHSLRISTFVFIFLLFKNMTSTLLCPSVGLSESSYLPFLPSFISHLVDRSVVSLSPVASRRKPANRPCGISVSLLLTFSQQAALAAWLQKKKRQREMSRGINTFLNK